VFQLPQCVRHFGERFERQIQRHQAVAQPRLVDAQRLEREIERVAGDLPEVDVSRLKRAKPSVLQLLVAPNRSEPVDVAPQNIAAAPRGSGEIEQRSICIEDAGLDPGKRILGHLKSFEGPPAARLACSLFPSTTLEQRPVDIDKLPAAPSGM
jgi:hypothetical protein